MSDITFPNNIGRYILGVDEDCDMDIDGFEVVKFNYRKIFGRHAHQNMSHLEVVFKFFGVENKSDVDMETQSQKLYFKDCKEKWKELFIFFCVMPFTEYEFEGKNGKLLNSDTLHNACPSDATSNLLIGTFTEVEFESMNCKIPDNRLAANLQSILKTDIFSKAYSEGQRKILITKLLGTCFKQDYELVKHVQSMNEIVYRDNFLLYLFKSISELVATFLKFETEVYGKNSVGQTGVHTKVPHATNDLFYSHPGIVAYSEKIHNR